MNYQQNEKMKTVFAAFRPYIEKHPAFDILYSEKLGCVKLYVDPEWENDALRFRNWQELLESLCHEIILDAITVSGKDTKTEKIMEISCRRVDEILQDARAATEELTRHAERCIQEFFLREEIE